jgi:sulfur relay (sulfurtransferase) DsrC/TusE family protein
MTTTALQQSTARQRAIAALRMYAQTGQIGMTVYEAAELADLLAQDLRKPLTVRQRQIHDYIRDFIRDWGYAPSYTDIASEFQFGSLATVNEHLVNLERKGWIRRAVGEARAISLMEATR